MSFPIIASSGLTNGTSLAGGVALNMPTSIESGNILLVFAVNDAPSSTNMGLVNANWQVLYSGIAGAGSDIKVVGWGKIARSGTETATLTGASQDYASVVLNITNHGATGIGDVKVGVAATGSSDNPDPPSLNAGLSRDWLWVVAVGSNDDDDTAVYEPTGYNPLAQLQSANSTSSCLLQVSYLGLTAQTENPSAGALAAAEPWLAQTLAIPDITGAVVTTFLPKTTFF